LRHQLDRREYGFPYRNATGMVEVAPIEPLFDKVEALLPNHGEGLSRGPYFHGI